MQDGLSTDGTLSVLDAWRSRLENGEFPIQCRSVEFTYESMSDGGMYDAIVTGRKHLNTEPNSFMTWINADDFLAPACLALVARVQQGFLPQNVSWLSGAATVMKDHKPIAQLERPTPTSVIKAGLCDGTHWDFVQQEGVFFRAGLWDEINAEQLIGNFRYAGDWNLWRLLAHRTEYVQVSWALGVFRKSEGQLSQVNYQAYVEEMDLVLPVTRRNELFDELIKQSRIPRYVLQTEYPSGKLFLVEKNAFNLVKSKYNQLRGLENDRVICSEVI